MDVTGELRPGRDFIIALGISVLAGVAIFAAPGPAFPILHTILNTGIALGVVAVSLLFWDLGWRTGAAPIRFLAIVYAVAGVLEILHVLAALEPSSASASLNEVLRQLRSGTWAPPAYLLPLGIGVTLWIAPTPRASKVAFAAGAVAASAGLFALFQWLPRYAEPGFLGILRPTLILVPLLWIPVGIVFWRRRAGDRIAHALAFYALGMVLAHSLMLYSDEAASKFAMTAHFGVFACGLFLLLGLMQMGTVDNARRMRIEQELKLSNEALEARVAARTSELERLNTDLRREIGVRHGAEVRALMQLERLDLLRRITRAIAERQDLESIFQVVVRSLEEHLPVDFAAMCTREDAGLKVTRVGTRSEQVALQLAMPPQSHIEIDQNGLARCIAGQQVYEPDITAVQFPFPQRLARAGLRSMVIVPLSLDEHSGVFAVLVVARRIADAFSSGECEFLRQLCDHVAIAANQAQLHESLQQAYEHLQRTQEAALEQERLRALGQMASGIAHDINNAISPMALYTEALLERESALSERGRKQLEIIQRAVDDVAQTVARMGEFYRFREPEAALAPIDLNLLVEQVLDLTRARWSDMAQQRGAVIELKLDLDPALPSLAGVQSQIRDALVNLVFNAVDAMPQGGTLSIRTRTAVRPNGSCALIEIADDGVGMDEETRRRCLEPFFSTKGTRGTGLGLAMVYGVVQRHGAQLEIDSEPGKGTVVRIEFPRAKGETATPADAAQVPVGPMRILIVDDDPMLLKSLRDALESDGHEVTSAGGGQAGINAFVESHAEGRPFPVVITDLGMPHVDGRKVASAIKASVPTTVVLMLTGWGRRLVAEGDIPAGVDAIISKPPRLADLRAALATHPARR